MKRLVFRVEDPITGLGPFRHIHKAMISGSLDKAGDFPKCTNKWYFGMLSLDHLDWWYNDCDYTIYKTDCVINVYRVLRGGIRMSPRVGRMKREDSYPGYDHYLISGQECLFRKDKAALVGTLTWSQLINKGMFHV